MSLSLDVHKTDDAVPTKRYDVVVVGAGPYGLSVAAHLLAQNLKVAVFGKPIYFWREHMPQGMLLRSYWWATDLSDPQKKYTVKRYYEEKGLQPADPMPIETFIDYALWFQRHAVPTVDETYVRTIQRQNGQFIVTLEDGRVVQSKALVMAPGLQYYRYCPPEFAHMPVELVSHSSDHRVLAEFAHKDVAVIGRGQAALETAALLNEVGANVQIVARHGLRWIPTNTSKLPAFLRQLRAPNAGMGSGWLNFLLEKYPYFFQRLPRNTRDYVLTTRHGPAGSPWLKHRIVDKVNIHDAQAIQKIAEVNGRVQLTLAEGKIIEIDHVLLATGYRADIHRLPMLDPVLRSLLHTYMKSPVLNSWFESNVPGLFFVGFSAARCCGPYYRFVIGDEAAARRVTQAVSRLVASRK